MEDKSCIEETKAINQFIDENETFACPQNGGELTEYGCLTLRVKAKYLEHRKWLCLCPKECPRWRRPTKKETNAVLKNKGKGVFGVAVKMGGWNEEVKKEASKKRKGKICINKKQRNREIKELSKRMSRDELAGEFNLTVNRISQILRDVYI